MGQCGWASQRSLGVDGDTWEGGSGSGENTGRNKPRSQTCLSTHSFPHSLSLQWLGLERCTGNPREQHGRHLH